MKKPERLLILVALNWTRDKDPRFPLGHASIAATFQSAKRPLNEIIASVNQNVDTTALTREILHLASRNYGPVDLAIGVYVWGESTTHKLLRELRKAGFSGRIILGGPQISFMKTGFEVSYPEADIFIRGHGEQALLDVTSSGSPKQLPGVHYAGQAETLSTSVADLTSLPSPWLSHDWKSDPLKFVRWETMRGCPYSCSFCQHRAPKRDARPIHLPPNRIMKEIEIFCSQGVESIAVLDPIFNISPICIPVLEAFAKRGFTGKLSLQCRAELIRPEFIEAARKLDVTLEFGLQTIHDNESKAIDRRNRIDRVEQTLSLVRDNDLNHEVSLIFGLPNQTLRSFKASVQWCFDQKVPTIKAFPLMLLRGTKLELESERYGLVESSDEIPIVIESKTFTHGEWKQMNAISEALKKTEGHHQSSLDKLMEPANESSDANERWSP